jgi:hypothetical protein
MLERTVSRSASIARKRWIGSWVTLGLLCAPAGLVLDAGRPAASAPPVERLHAGPIDDTLYYIDCLLKRLQNLPCAHDEDDSVWPSPPSQDSDPLPEPPEPVYPGDDTTS